MSKYWVDFRRLGCKTQRSRLWRGAGFGNPAYVLDAKQVHNHGLNLSRAWCMRGLMQALTPGEVRWTKFGVLSGDHLRAAEAAITGGEYVSTHWLISFAMLAETEWHL